MGQTHFFQCSPHLKALEEDWKLHPFENNVFCHTKSKMQVQRFLIIPTERQKQIFQKRLRDHHTHIIKVMHCQKVRLIEKNGQSKQGMFIFVQRIFKLIKKDWTSIQTALAILKGFRRLSRTFGNIKISKQMIGINPQGQVKLWIHQIPIVYQPQFFVDSEKKMLQGLISIIAQNDPVVGLLIVGASTFNQAINNILIDLSKKSSLHTQRYKLTQKIKNQAKLKNNKRVLFTKKIKSQKIMNGLKNLGNLSLLNNKRQLQANNSKLKYLSPNNYGSKPNLKFNQNICLKKNKHEISTQQKGKNSLKYEKKRRVRHSSNDYTDKKVSIQRFKRFQTQNFNNITYKYPKQLFLKKSQSKIAKKQFLKPSNLIQQKREQYFEQSLNPEIKVRKVVKVNTCGTINLWQDQISQQKYKTEKTKESLQTSNKSKKQKEYICIQQMNKHIEQMNKHIQQCKNLNKSSNSDFKNQLQLADEQLKLQKQISKKNFSKKLRLEFGQVLDLKKNQENDLAQDQKSKKDLKIRNKIIKKKETFAELKKEAMKLLDEESLL